jgi:hypothetical protein
MLTFSYTISPSLKNEIEKIDQTRNKILTQLLSRAEEMQLRWEIGLERAMHASRLGTDKLTRQEVFNQLAPPKEAQDKSGSAAHAAAYEWINQHWQLNKETVKIQDLEKVLAFFGRTKNIDLKQLKEVLDFVQVNPEHPIVQAGLVFYLVSQVLMRESDYIKLSSTISSIFLYKAGYDFRGMAIFEEFLVSDLDHFKQLIDQGARQRNLSDYLEYFTQAISISAERALRRVINKELKNDLPSSFYQLTERQKDIMMLFVKPGVKVSNKTVQKEFGISQITASRDLAKLHTLGLIFSAGKGRSVYYTRI